MYQRGDIKEGMTVRSIDGHKLGKVYSVGDGEFHIEKGLFFPKDYAVRYAEIRDLSNGEIILAHGKDSLRASSDFDELPSRAPIFTPQDGIGTSPLIQARDTDITWRNQRERTDLPSSSRPEGMRTSDLGIQEVGPFNTEGASDSPILTEEDRRLEATRSSTRASLPIPPAPVDRRTLRADEAVSREPVLTELDEDRTFLVRDELYDDPRDVETRRDQDVDGSRKFNLTGEDEPLKRGF